MLAQLAAGQDHRILHADRVPPALVHAAVSVIADELLMVQRRLGLHCSGRPLHDGGDVLALSGVHGAVAALA